MCKSLNVAVLYQLHSLFSFLRSMRTLRALSWMKMLPDMLADYRAVYR